MKTLVSQMADIEKAKNDHEAKNDHDIQVIHWVTKWYPIIHRGLEVPNSLLPFEARASKSLLDTLSNRWGGLDTSNNRSPEDVFSFLIDFYDIVRDSKAIFFPKEHIRRLLRFIDKFKIVSAKFVAEKSCIENLETKKSARTALKRLFNAGIVEKYSASILIARIDKPLANLRRTELYGVPSLDETGYRDIIDFYSSKTTEAHDDERFKRGVWRTKKEVIDMKEDHPITVYQLKESIRSLELSIKSLKHPRTRGDKKAIPEMERRLTHLKKRLEERESG